LVVPEDALDGTLAVLEDAVAIGRLAARPAGGEGVELL
jgi:hypothetical protein